METSLGNRLAMAEASADYYFRLINDTNNRLKYMQAAAPSGDSTSKIQQVLEEHREILHESWRLADAEACQLRGEIAGQINDQPSLVQLSELTIAGWKDVQARIEHLEIHGGDPMELASKIAQRDAIEKSIWVIEYKIRLDLMLTHEAMAALRPVIDSVFSAAVRAGISETFEHFLVTAFAGVGSIRPTIPRIAEAQERIAASLGIPVRCMP